LLIIPFNYGLRIYVPENSGSARWSDRRKCPWPIGGARGETPIAVNVAAIVRASETTATKLICDLHLGHCKTSTPNVRLSSAAHVT